MFSKIAKFLAKIGGWKYDPFPDVKKGIFLMAPHTSMLDFYYGRLYFMIYKKMPHVLIKKEVFKWPIGPILKKLGGIPVKREKGTAISPQILREFKEQKEFYLVITPEATRKKNKNWKRGFIRIAKNLDVPVVMGYLDCEKKIWGIKGILDMSGTDKEIMDRLKKNYVGLKGVHPENFETGLE